MGSAFAFLAYIICMSHVPCLIVALLFTYEMSLTKKVMTLIVILEIGAFVCCPISFSLINLILIRDTLLLTMHSAFSASPSPCTGLTTFDVNIGETSICTLKIQACMHAIWTDGSSHVTRQHFSTVSFAAFVLPLTHEPASQWLVFHIHIRWISSCVGAFENIFRLPCWTATEIRFRRGPVGGVCGCKIHFVTKTKCLTIY